MIYNVFEYFGRSSGLYPALDKYHFHRSVSFRQIFYSNVLKSSVKTICWHRIYRVSFPMNQEQKQTFIRNVMKLIVGLVLLFISYGYLQNHPAEKVSVLSGFEVMYQR